MKKIPEKSPNVYTFTPESPVGFHCYIVSQNCAKKLLKYMDKSSYHVDVAMLNHAHKLNIYASSKTLAFQYTNADSSTQTEGFPIILNKILDKYKCRKNISYSYYFSAPIFGISKYNVNSYLILLLLLTVLTPSNSKLYVACGLIFYFILELYINIYNYNYILFWCTCIVLTHVLKRLFVFF